MNLQFRRGVVERCIVCYPLSISPDAVRRWNYCAQCGRLLFALRWPLGQGYRHVPGLFCVFCGCAHHDGACADYRDEPT